MGLIVSHKASDTALDDFDQLDEIKYTAFSLLTY
jgi:hypothetical protein